MDICCLLIFGLIYLAVALSLLFVFFSILDCICCRKRLCALFGVGHNSKYLGSAVDTWCHSKSWWTQGTHPRCFYAHPSPRVCEQNIKHFSERAAAFEIVGSIFLHLANCHRRKHSDQNAFCFTRLIQLVCVLFFNFVLFVGIRLLSWALFPSST